MTEFAANDDSSVSTGISCLAFVLHQLRIPVPTFEAEIKEPAAKAKRPRRKGTNANLHDSVDRLLAIAGNAGVDVECATRSLADLSSDQQMPCLAALNSGNFVVICGHSIDSSGKIEKLLLFDPLASTRSKSLWIDAETFAAAWPGVLLFVRGHPPERRDDMQDGTPDESTQEPVAEAGPTERPTGISTDTPSRKFSLSWFAPYIRQNAHFFRDVAVLSLFIHLLSLAPPIFFQIVVDRILVHHVFETLVVLTIGVTFAIAFGAFFEYARDRILLHAANRMDAAIYPKTFSHLSGLPLHYFDKRPVGVLVKHMQQSEFIREFLTGRLLLSLLNASVLIVIVPVLFYYNATLALIAVGVSAIMIIAMVILIFPLRRRLTALYCAEGSRQAMLVEALQGIATVKSLSIEEPKSNEWNSTSAETIAARHKVQRLQIAVQTTLQFFEQGMLVVIVVAGAMFVIGGSMTIGALIAFQILAQRMTQPLLELIGLGHQLQETHLSLRMLGEVMNATPEQADSARRIRPRISGEICFNRVSFTYPRAKSRALEDVSFDISAGEFVGIVGRTGSGKTTLARLILAHYLPEQGTISFDGNNVADIDIGHLRRHISVVLQETFLFSGSVLSNIAASNPEASFEEIEAAARAAGALEFIERLPRRYDTWLDEGARNLSGGQRQRLGLARALLVNRPILILDEATSSLDPESEAKIRERLPLICKGRTVVLISHKLSLLTDADRIIVLEQGRRIQEGRHAELINLPGLYAQLWQQQSAPYLPQQSAAE